MYSFFMHDDSYSNQGYEHMLDFQMSWILRVAASKERSQNNFILYKRCFDVLMKLIEKSPNDKVEVISVNVWKQWKRIDVLANVMIKCNDKEERHLIVIENKAYTKIHNDQLNRYEKIINKEYGNDNFQRDFIKHFWVITLSGLNESGEYDNNYWILKSMCDSAYADWKLLSFDDVMDDDTPTGSEHFDDFWIYNW